MPVKPILHREEVSRSEMHKVLQIVLAGYEKGQGNLFHWVAMYDKLQLCFIHGTEKDSA